MPPPLPAVPRWRPTLASLFRGALLSCVVSAVVLVVYAFRHDAQIARNDLLRSEVGRLQEQAKKVTELRAELDALKARALGVDDLGVQRTRALRQLNAVVNAHEEAIWLVADDDLQGPHSRKRYNRLQFTEVQETPNGVEISGRMESLEQLAVALRELNYNNNEFRDSVVRVVERDETTPASGMPYRFTALAVVKPTVRPVQVQDRKRAHPAARRDPP